MNTFAFGEALPPFKVRATELLDQFIQSKDNNSKAYLGLHRKRYLSTIEILINLLNGILSVNPKKKIRILELGTSGFFPVIIGNLFDCDCVDVTEYANPALYGVKNAVHTIGDLSFKSKSYQIDFDSNFFPCGDEFYDLIICLEVIEHVGRDPVLFMSELNRLLIQEGLLLISTPNICATNRVKQMLEGWHPYFFCAFNKNLTNDRHHLEYSPQLLRQLIESSGFDEVSLETLDVYAEGDIATIEILLNNGYPTEYRGDTIFSVSKKVSEVRKRFPDMLYA